MDPTFGSWAVGPQTDAPLTMGGQVSPEILARLRDSFMNAARGTAAGAQQAVEPFQRMASYPGQVWQRGVAGDVPTTEEMVPWAADTAQSLAGVSTPFSLAGSAGVFGGRLAQTADKRALVKAQEMAYGGTGTREGIWKETGWFQGPDGKWRFEIPDVGARMKTEGLRADANLPALPLGQRLVHPRLFEAYPQLAEMPIERLDTEGGRVLGAYNPPIRGIQQMKDRPPKFQFPPDAETTTGLHEVQHAIQDIEGFPMGAGGRAPITRGSPAYKIRQEQYEKFAHLGRMSREDASRAVGLPEGALLSEGHFAEMRRLAEGKKLSKNAQTEFDKQAQRQAYLRQSGEVEARNVERRYKEPELASTGPWHTESVPWNMQFQRFYPDFQADIRKTLTRLKKRWGAIPEDL